MNNNLEQVTLEDGRFYLDNNGKAYPSITTVLNYYPKGEHFENWLKQVGFASNYIVKKASDEGTQVHNLIEKYLKGEKITFLNSSNYPLYTKEIWEMFNRFVDFWETYKPELLHSEIKLFSNEFGMAGTCDLICKINNKIWVIDHKTSNQIHTPYELQIEFYASAYEEMFDTKVDKLGILWLKSKTRKFNKENMRGHGWNILQSKRSREENKELLKATKKIFDVENVNTKPQIKKYRKVIQLKK